MINGTDPGQFDAIAIDVNNDTVSLCCSQDTFHSVLTYGHQNATQNKYNNINSYDISSVKYVSADIGRGACRKVGGQTSAVMASAGARAYNGGLGAERPAGSRGRAPGQGVRKLKSFLRLHILQKREICGFCQFIDSSLQPALNLFHIIMTKCGGGATFPRTANH